MDASNIARRRMLSSGGTPAKPKAPQGAPAAPPVASRTKPGTTPMRTKGRHPLHKAGVSRGNC